ncbi:extracellular solute-binding protein [Microbacterium sp. Clip185]|uniref:extracellular solute-binding protein n=1 Tax=Microbacterium sp. Clip185 TaxID=3025663 RepID=UPI002365F8F5|nr:extracellular solute-binding protein [Microbacterium sp. Clip185]WDG18040.1 extracellular solute-binding protein [Microbacterium sp. Clip185]
MIRTRKAVAAGVTLAAAASLILAGCSGQAQPQGTVAADGPVTVDFWYSVGGSSADALLKQVTAFNAENAVDITINPIYQGDYTETAAKLTNAVQSGDTPVLLQGGDTFSAYLHDSGLATAPESITTFDGQNYTADDVVAAAANYYTFDGELWAVPLMVSQPAVFFDATKLQAAGLSGDKPPASIDELFDWADKIYAATGTPGLVFQQNEWWNEQFSALNNVVYCTPDNGLGADPATAFDFVDDDLVDVWTHYQKSLQAGAIVNVGSDGVAAQNAFSVGQAAMLLASSASLGATTAAASFEISAFALPVATKGGGAVPGGSALWILGEGHSDAEKAAAVEFARFMGSADVQRQIFEDSGYLPSNQGALDGLLASETSQPKLALLTQLTDTAKTAATGGCHNGAFGQSRADVRSAIQAIAGGADVRSSLEKAQAKGTDQLTTYNERVSK